MYFNYAGANVKLSDMLIEIANSTVYGNTDIEVYTGIHIDICDALCEVREIRDKTPKEIAYYLLHVEEVNNADEIVEKFLNKEVIGVETEYTERDPYTALNDIATIRIQVK